MKNSLANVGLPESLHGQKGRDLRLAHNHWKTHPQGISKKEKVMCDAGHPDTETYTDLMNFFETLVFRCGENSRYYAFDSGMETVEVSTPFIGVTGIEAESEEEYCRILKEMNLSEENTLFSGPNISVTTMRPKVVQVLSDVTEEIGSTLVYEEVPLDVAKDSSLELTGSWEVSRYGEYRVRVKAESRKELKEVTDAMEDYFTVLPRRFD